MIAIGREDPLGADLGVLMARHQASMHAQSPPESIHMMDAGQLADPKISFFVMRDGGVPVAMGAFKLLAPDHAEIKSMHVLAECRGRGLARQMLDHLAKQARAAGALRLSLETGAQEVFNPAHALYRGAGFTSCGPFGQYRNDPNSVFMTRTLAEGPN
ncbi:MAG: GNAT family N-acetyltransferase [Albidovulum sp.]